MADFFGGIFDDIRAVGNDASGFFKSTLGQAIAKGAKTALKQDDNTAKVNPKEGFIDGGYNSFESTKTSAKGSNNFANTEIEWYKRLQRFAGIVESTEVKK